MVVYKITNIVNNKFYIGSTVDFSIRQAQHLNHLRKGDHQDKLQNAYNKYGEDKFIFDILETIQDKTQLLTREQFYLDSLQPWYNICKTAGNKLGVKDSNETKEKKRQKALGRTPSNITKKKMSISASNRAGNLSEKQEEHYKNLSIQFKGRVGPMLGKKSPKAKKIGQYDLNNNLIKFWRSRYEIFESLNIHPGNIGACCRGDRKQASGYIWKFE